MKAFCLAIATFSDDGKIKMVPAFVTAISESGAIGKAYEWGKKHSPNSRIEVCVHEISRDYLMAMLEAVDKEAT